MMNRNHNQNKLTLYQKMFNQRLLAEHCWTEEYAESIYYNEIIPSSSSISQSQSQQNDNNSDIIPFLETIKMCNVQLHHFGLEIVSITIPEYDMNNDLNSNTRDSITNDENDEDDDDENEDDDDDDEENENTPSKKKSKNNKSKSSRNNNNNNNRIMKQQKYYIMINQFPDTITKDVYQNYIFSNNNSSSSTTQVSSSTTSNTSTNTSSLSLQLYVKHILMYLIQQYPKPVTRSTILNLKNDISNININSNSNINNNKDTNTTLTALSQSSTNTKTSLATTTTTTTTTNAKLSLSIVEDMIERLIDEQWLIEMNHKQSKQSSKRNSNNYNKVYIMIGPRSYAELSYLFNNTTNNHNNNDHTSSILPQPIYIRY